MAIFVGAADGVPVESVVVPEVTDVAEAAEVLEVPSPSPQPAHANDQDSRHEQCDHSLSDHDGSSQSNTCTRL